MKKFLFLMTCVVSIMLYSCGGDDIKPADPPITYTAYQAGFSLEKNYVNVPVKGMFEIESVAATIVPDDEHPHLYSIIKASINVKTITTPPAEGHNLQGDCTVQLLDKNNAVIAETSWGISGRSDLFNSEAGDMTTLSADLGDDWSQSMAEEMLSKVKYIRLAGVGCGYEKSESATSDSFNSNTEETSTETVDLSSDSSETSDDWDAVLDSYDNYVTKYIQLYKNATNGDSNALSEYPAMIQEADRLSKKLANAKGTLSEAQWARYTQITNRMAAEIAK